MARTRTCKDGTDANGTRKTNDAYCIKKTEEEEEERGFYLCCFCESSNEEIDDVFDKKLHLISRTFTKTSLKFREREKTTTFEAVPLSFYLLASFH